MIDGLKIKIGAFELELSQETVSEASLLVFLLALVAAVVTVWVLA